MTDEENQLLRRYILTSFYIVFQINSYNCTRMAKNLKRFLSLCKMTPDEFGSRLEKRGEKLTGQTIRNIEKKEELSSFRFNLFLSELGDIAKEKIKNENDHSLETQLRICFCPTPEAFLKISFEGMLEFRNKNNITPKAWAEEIIREYEEKYSQLNEEIPSAYFLTDIDYLRMDDNVRPFFKEHLRTLRLIWSGKNKKAFADALGTTENVIIKYETSPSDFSDKICLNIFEAFMQDEYVIFDSIFLVVINKNYKDEVKKDFLALINDYTIVLNAFVNGEIQRNKTVAWLEAEIKAFAIKLSMETIS